MLERHPRPAWPSHRNFALAQFWLERHALFREQLATLRDTTREHLDGKYPVAQFQLWLGPRLQGFLSALHGHHQIEDQHYFPAFRAAEPRLAAGFDTLDSDHRLIHECIVATVEAANELLRTPASGAVHPHAGRYADSLERLHGRLLNHLDDEEDLIIPVMLEHGG